MTEIQILIHSADFSKHLKGEIGMAKRIL